MLGNYVFCFKAAGFPQIGSSSKSLNLIKPIAKSFTKCEDQCRADIRIFLISLLDINLDIILGCSVNIILGHLFSAFLHM
jgi:hypothetical protein